MQLKDLIFLVKETVREFGEDKASRLAAALSYYTLFSLAPLLVIVIAIVGLVFGREAAQNQIVGQIEALVGSPEAAQAIQDMIAGAARQDVGLLATIIGLVTLLLGAAGVFGQLHEAFNTIWEVKPKAGGGVLRLLKDRFFSFSMVLGVGFLLLVSLVVTAAITAAADSVLNAFGELAWLAQIINFLVSFAIITGLFALMFKILPDAKIAWKDVGLGAAVTSLLFSLGRMAIGIYLGSGNMLNAYGAAGSLVIILVWVNYSAQIMFFGAEFTQVYANRFGSGIQPEKGASLLTEAERTAQGLTRTPPIEVPAGSRARPLPAPVLTPITGEPAPAPRVYRSLPPREPVPTPSGAPVLAALFVGLVAFLGGLFVKRS